MAVIDNYFKTSKGKQLRVKVPSSQGGADRTIYLGEDGKNSGYKLGSHDNKVYTKEGRYVSKSLKEFIETYY